MNSKNHPYRNLLETYLRPQLAGVIILAVLLLANIATQLANPQIVRYFIDTVQTKGDMSLLFRAAILYLIVAVIQQVVSACAAYLSEKVGWKATNALRIDLTRHCLKLDLSFHNTHTPGEMIERIDGDINTLSSFFSRFVIQVLGNALLLVGILVLLFRRQLVTIGTVYIIFQYTNMLQQPIQAISRQL